MCQNFRIFRTLLIDLSLFRNKKRNPKKKIDAHNFNVSVIQIHWIPIPWYRSLGVFVWEPKALFFF